MRGSELVVVQESADNIGHGFAILECEIECYKIEFGQFFIPDVQRHGIKKLGIALIFTQERE